MDQNKIGKLIARLRKENNMTQNELAKRLGVTDRAISKWENGRGMPDLAAIQPLAETLGVSTDELLSGKCAKFDASEGLSEKEYPIYELSEEDAGSASFEGEESKNSKVKYLIIIGAALTAVLLAFLVLCFDFFKDDDAVVLVAVPSVEGKSLVEATKLLDEVGIGVETLYEHSDTVPRTCVISQSGEAGSQVTKGSKITLVISSGKEQITLPKVVGRSPEEAEAELKGLGFTVSVVEIFSNDVEKGKVAVQSVSNGIKADKGSNIIISVSKGPDYVTVPNLKGMTKAEAEETLTEAGLLIKTEYRFNVGGTEGRIISQSVSAKGQAIRGSEVCVQINGGRTSNKGTTPSNANQWSHVTTQGNWIYFVGETDRGIYRMSKDGSKIERLYTGYPVSLNVVGEWMYFADGTNEGGIYKVKIDGTEETRLSYTTSYKLYVEGDWIYYTSSWNHGNLYKMKTDGSGVTQITKESCTDYIISGQNIYYTKGSDRLVYKCKADGSGETLVCAGFGGEDLCLVGDRLAVTTGYMIQTVKTDGSDFTSFGKINVQCSYLNGCDGWIYYLEHDFTSAGKESYYCKVKPDGSKKTRLYQYEYLNHANGFINVVDGWLYFQNEHQNDELFRITTSGKNLSRVG